MLRNSVIGIFRKKSLSDMVYHSNVQKKELDTETTKSFVFECNIVKCKGS
jgi:hypothetical protein